VRGKYNLKLAGGRSAGISMLSYAVHVRVPGMSNGIMYVINVDLYEGVCVLCEAFSSWLVELEQYS